MLYLNQEHVTVMMKEGRFFFFLIRVSRRGESQSKWRNQNEISQKNKTQMGPTNFTPKR